MAAPKYAPKPVSRAESKLTPMLNEKAGDGFTRIYAESAADVLAGLEKMGAHVMPPVVSYYRKSAEMTVGVQDYGRKIDLVFNAAVLDQVAEATANDWKWAETMRGAKDAVAFAEAYLKTPAPAAIPLRRP